MAQFFHEFPVSIFYRSQAPRNHRTGSCLPTPRVTTGMLERWTINQKPTQNLPWCLVLALNNFVQEDPFADLRKQEEDPWFVQSTRSLHLFTVYQSLFWQLPVSAAASSFAPQENNKQKEQWQQHGSWATAKSIAEDLILTYPQWFWVVFLK